MQPVPVLNTFLKGIARHAVCQSNPAPAQPISDTPVGPPESAHLTTRLAEVSYQLDQLELQRETLQRDHHGLTERYDAAVIADVQGTAGEDPAAVRIERDRIGDKLAGNDRLRRAASSERDELNDRLRTAMARERREALQRAFDEGKVRLTDRAGRVRQAYPDLCAQLADLNLTLDPFYGDFAEIGGPQFASGISDEVSLGYAALERMGWHYVTGRGGIAGLEVVAMVPQRPNA